ncbi:MAG: type II secretion system F family protein [Pseudobdellovibrionaceae bacterium]
MARYSFQAKNFQGKMVAGELEAGSEVDAKNKIRGQQLIPLRIVARGEGPATAATPIKGESFLTALLAQRVDTKSMQIFTRQLSVLVNAGIPVVDALRILGQGMQPGLLKDATLKTKSLIENGRKLGDAMGATPTVFDRFYVNMVRASEETGKLDVILNRMATYLDKTAKIKGQVKGALVYPAIIISVAVLVITLILIYVIPKFQELYGNSGKELPAITQMVVGLSNFVINKWYLVIGSLIFVPMFALAYYRTEEGKETCDRLFLQIPLFGALIQKSSIARLSRTLSTLLSSGVSLTASLEIAGRTAGNVTFEEIMERSKAAVTEGKPLANPLQKEKWIPDMVVQMIMVGEQTGATDQMLSKVADFYEDEVDNAVRAMTSVIEPLMMAVLGGIIAFLVVAMYLPVFDMASVVGG